MDPDACDSKTTERPAATHVPFSTSATASCPEMPAWIGPYRLLEVLGRGGMGVVYRAQHGDTGAVAALKSVRVPHAGLLQSLRREIHALARLRHPGIVRILDEGLHEGLPWYAMELLEGKPLSRWWSERCAQDEDAASAGSGERIESQTPPQPGPTHWWTEQLESPTALQSPTVSASGVFLGQDRAAPTRSTGPRAFDPAMHGGPTRVLADPRAGEAARLPAARGRLREVLTLVRRLCEPLAFLHGEGIVHRDLKPANILLRNSESRMENGELKLQSNGQSEILNSQFSILNSLHPVLVDFGLVTQFSAEVSREALDSGPIGAGTLAYMAPEQARGELVDARADLYALGCLLYELVCGRRPFQGASERELLDQHQKAAPRRPSELVEGVTPELEELMLRLLAKRPQDRPGHADDVAEALAKLGAEADLVAAAAAPRPRPYLYRSALVGRSTAMRPLREVLSRLQSGCGGLLLISGESGVGKTRLVLELAREAAACDCQVLAGEAAPEAGGPLALLRRPLQLVADHCREEGAQATRQLLGRRGKVLALIEPALAQVPGMEAYPEPERLEGDAARLRLLADLAETLAALSAQGPVLLALDDLQWADELSLEALSYLLRSGGLERRPLLVLGTYRAEELSEGLARLLEAPGTRRLELGRLDEPAVADMVRQMLGLNAPPQRFAQYLASHSEGNPFFVAEMLRTSVEEGLLWRDAHGRWQVGAANEQPAGAADFEALPLRRSLVELVGRRLEGLQPDARTLVEAAAVLGRKAEDSLLAAMSGLGDEQLLEASRQLLRRQVLDEAGGGWLRFAHDKIREVAYTSLSPDRRRAWHAAAARALDGLPPEQRLQRLGELGRHCEEAGEPDRARSFYLTAARRALDQGIFQEALRQGLRAKRLCGTADAGSALDAGLVCAEALTGLGRYGEALQSASETVEAAAAAAGRPDAHEVAGLDEKRWKGQLLLSALHQRRGDYPAGLAMADEVLRTGRTELARGEASLRRATVLYSLGRYGEARDEMDSLQSRLRMRLQGARTSPELKLLAGVLSHLARVDSQQGAYGSALAVCREALSLQREIGNRPGVAQLLSLMGFVHLELDAFEPALAAYEEARAILGEIGDRRSAAAIRNGIGIVHSRRGAFDEALRAYEEGLSIWREIGELPFIAAALNNIGLVHLQRGALAAALEVFEEALEIWSKLGERRGIARILHNLGTVHLWQERYEPALAALEKALALRRELGERRHVASTLHWIGRLHCERGAYEAALQATNAALQITRALGDRSGIAEDLLALGLVHRSQGAVEAAFPALEQALAIRRELGQKGDIAEGLRELGVLYAEQGRWSDGERLLAESVDLCEQLQMKQALGRALAARARLRLDAGWQGAREDAERALGLFRELGIPAAEGATLSTLARLCAHEGNLGLARRTIEQARALVSHGAALQSFLQVLEDEAAVDLACGDRAGAARLAHEAAALARQRGAAQALRRIEPLLERLAAGSSG